MFMEKLRQTLNEDFNVSITENGAIGYRTSGTALVDINFAITSLRNKSEREIVDKFVKAFYEDKMLAMKWLFYARDVREGVGERRLFRACMEYLAKNHVEIAKAVIPLIPIYGRYDDWFCLMNTELEDFVIKEIKEQLAEDMEFMAEGKPISLLAKWMPSANTSSKATRELARKIIRKLEITERQYRKMLAKLRDYLKVVEVSMSKNEWKAIDYSAVPSRANLIYNSAFLRNDEARRRDFLARLEKGETKINAGVLFPHDIVHKYVAGCGRSLSLKSKDTAIEELWKALPDFVKGDANTICVSDGSGSMTVKVGGTTISALEVAISLSIYFAERCKGQFKDKYITFSNRPQLVDFSRANSLREKIEIALRYSEVASTNIEAVFDLILETAIQNKMTQAEIPARILILSDMEFNYSVSNCNARLFKVFEDRYAAAGYKLPRIIFWNINSRTGTIPMKTNELGVALVSGFSPAVVNTVFSNARDPYECLVEQLNAERYDAVEAALIDICK